MNHLRLVLLGSVLVFAVPVFAAENSVKGANPCKTASATQPEGNGNVTDASAGQPEGNGNVTVASAQPEGNGNVTSASAIKDSAAATPGGCK